MEPTEPEDTKRKSAAALLGGLFLRVADNFRLLVLLALAGFVFWSVAVSPPPPVASVIIGGTLATIWLIRSRMG